MLSNIIALLEPPRIQKILYLNTYSPKRIVSTTHCIYCATIHLFKKCPIIFSISEIKKKDFFSQGVVWAQKITNSSRLLKKAIHGSTKTNWMNSRGSPGNQFRQKLKLLYIHLFNFGIIVK